MIIRLSFKKCLALLGLIGSLVWLAAFSFPDSRLHLVFCDVGQGDATLITKGFNQILIDGGPNDKVLDCLAKNMPFFDKTIEIVALTHPEADHLTGIISVIDKYRVEYFLTGPEGSETAGYQALVKALEARGVCKGRPCMRARPPLKIVNPYSGERIKVGDIVLQTLWPEKEWVAERLEGEDEMWEVGNNNPPSFLTPDSLLTSHPHPAVLGVKATDTHLNDYSLVFLLTYNGKRVLLMGDADTRVQDKIVDSSQQSVVSNIDILKFPHHGSKTGMGKTFLEQIKPKEAVISVGKNSFGHPTQEALDMLKTFNVIVRRTDLEGEIKYVY